MTGTTVAVEQTLDWDVFAEKYWDRAPVLFTDPGPGPFEATDGFAAAVAACTPRSGDVIDEAVQLMAEERRIMRSRGRVPCPADGGFDAYAARIGEAFGGRRHALVVSGLHSHDPRLWERERDFFAPLWERVGLPATTAITTLFHGNYEHSPVGVHKDRYATFMYVLSGRKRMRMWPTRPWSHDASTIVDYGRYLDDSLIAEPGPGQLVYWPSSHFHVGETVGSAPATSVNVGVPREGRRVELEIGDLVGDVPIGERADADAYLAARLPPTAAEPFTSAPVALPDALREGLDLAASLLERSWNGPRRIGVTLDGFTSGGFRPAPAPDPLPALTPATVLRRRARASVLWARVDEANALCSADGHLAETVLSPAAMAAVLGRLPVQGGVSVAEALYGVPEGERAAAGALLAELVSFRAVEPVGRA